MEEQMKKMYTLYPYPNYDSKHDKYAPIPAQFSPFCFCYFCILVDKITTLGPTN